VTPKSASHVTIYHAADCSLCARALEVVRGVQDELGFDLELVDIEGDPELESRYRESLPVVEIDGQRVFTYFVDAETLRRRPSLI
jgi:glutaredoxin